jgi:hypothetical protein
VICQIGVVLYQHTNSPNPSGARHEHQDHRRPQPEHAKVIPFSARRSYRDRSVSGFGVGYGNSSGYALDKRYTTDWGQIRFRCA